MVDHADDFAAAFAETNIDIAEVFYCAESVLLPAYRGQGAGHGFFDAREAHARTLGFGKSAFCSVIRPADHPLRPADYAPLDPFWRKRGYAPLPGVMAQFSWKDVDQKDETAKSLQFWCRDL
jgi:GNAT superfamily N-acetyltransferase